MGKPPGTCLLSAVACMSVLTLLLARPAAGAVVNVGNPRSLGYGWNTVTNWTWWSANVKIFVGDTLVFKYPKYQDVVVRFPRRMDYLSCNYARSTVVCGDIAGSTPQGCRITVGSGVTYYGSGMYGRCRAGQKVTITARVRHVPRNIVVGYNTVDFAWPWNVEVNYATWLANTKIYVGDTLIFKYRANMDEVYIVPSRANFTNCFYEQYLGWCNATDGVGMGCYSNPLPAGTTYFVSGVYSHCTAGQRIAVTPLPIPT